MHVLRRLPVLHTLVGTFSVLSDELYTPVPPRLLSIYICGIGAETEAAVLALVFGVGQ